MFLLKFCAISWCICTFASALPRKPEDKPACGYESCHPVKEGYINVHIVPHTHDDVGWLKTVDQYYYGLYNNIQNAGVQYILDSVVDALRKDEKRRFIYVETAFFWKWWLQQHDFVKHQVQKFVRNGQLEIIGGAWSMNDEAIAHYHSIIDQFTWGLRKLNETFGECGRPKIGWQIDPFGHSREMASIFAQLGYDGLLLGRIDYQDKKNRFKTKTPEFIWQGSDNLGDKSKIFTSIMYNTYSPPPGFCFDILCYDEPIVDNNKNNDISYNVDRRVNQFFEYLDNVTKVYTTNNVIITMGEDFNYQQANTWFKNIDKLILYSNERQKKGSKYNLIYSTPSCYLKAVQDAAKDKIQWVVETDDFFPYASDEHSFWTGYFTSRPTLKRYERIGNNFLQVCKQLYSLTDLGPEDWADLNVLREAMGVMQHHDAITGTEKQHVANDYARLLSNGIDECEFVAATALSKIVTGNKVSKSSGDPSPEIDFQSCLLANVSQCNLTETLNDFVVTVYNPLSRNVTHYVRLPVSGMAYTVTDYQGKSVPTQLIPVPKTIATIPGRFSQATLDLIFVAEDIPPLGFLSFYVSKINGSIPSKSHAPHYDTQFSVDETTGKLSEIKMNGLTIPITQDFFYYRGAVGDNVLPKFRSSGAYIFRPNGTVPIRINSKASTKLYEGDIVTELHQVFNNWTSQIIRVYREEKFVEFDWLIGPIPINDVNGKEIITKYTTNLRTNSTFYTDSNGREYIKRIRNFRPTWNLNLSETVSGNYYPVTSKIMIRNPDDKLVMAVLTDRGQGGSSLKDGEVELMLHRNCLHDDAFGVGEELKEQAFGKGLVARGSHYLIAGSASDQKTGKSIAAQERDIVQRKILSAWTFVSSTQSLSFKDYSKKYRMKYSGLVNSLPDNVQILTLEPWKATTFLLRLEHVFEKGEDPTLSKPVVVNLKNLFTAFDIIWYNETTLGGNQWLQDNARNKMQDATSPRNSRANEDLEWQIRTEHLLNDQINSNDIYTLLSKYHYTTEDRDNLDFTVELEPMQIRTFVIEVEKKVAGM